MARPIIENTGNPLAAVQGRASPLGAYAAQTPSPGWLKAACCYPYPKNCISSLGFHLSAFGLCVLTIHL